jgi:hypothetical protein
MELARLIVVRCPGSNPAVFAVECKDLDAAEDVDR